MRFGTISQLGLVWFVTAVLLIVLSSGRIGSGGGSISSNSTEPAERRDEPVTVAGSDQPNDTGAPDGDGPPPEDVAATNARVLVPVDDGGDDAAFVTVRNGLRSAVDARNLDATLTFTADDVKTSFDEDANNGEQFKALLSDEETGEAYWLRLQDILTFAAVRDAEGRLCAPYYACSSEAPAMQGVDLFNSVVVIEEDVPVLEGPDPQSKTIETVSYAVVDLISYLDDQPWAEIRLTDGREGFIDRAALREPVSFKAVFEMRDGAWKLASFRTGNE